MKNKYGFTLIELLGIIAIIGILFSLAIVGYININNHIKKMYYKSLEDNIKVAVTEYYNYNKPELSNIIENYHKVTLNDLITNNYIDEIKDQNGEKCNFNSSFGVIYKETNNKIVYKVCLICNDYKTDNSLCNNS